MSERTEKLKQSAQDFWDRGWLCTPCRLSVDFDYWGDMKKHPDFGLNDDGKPVSWKKVQCNIESTKHRIDNFKSCHGKYPANALAIITGPRSNLLVLDIDAPVNAGYKWLENAGVILYNDCFTTETPNGGHHIYFKYPKELEGYKTTRNHIFGTEAPVDLRGDGGIIFAPGSEVYVHGAESGNNKRSYTIPKPADGVKYKIHDCPQGLLKLITTRREHEVENQAINLEACTKSFEDLTEAQRAALNRSIERSDTAPVGTRSERDIGLLTWAIRLGLARDATKLVVRTVGKFREKEEQGHFDGYFDSLYNSALRLVDSSKRSYSADQSGLRKKADDLAAKKKAVDIDEAAKRILSKKHDYSEEVQYISPPILGRGMVGGVFGEPGQGKTIMLYSMIRDIRTDSEFWGGRYRIKQQPKILYIQADLTPQQCKRYIDNVGVIEGEHYDHRYYEDLAPADGIDFDFKDSISRALFRALIERGKYDLIILDSVVSLLTSEGKNHEIAETLRYLKSIAAEQNCCIIYVTHPRKDSSSNDKFRRKALDLNDAIGASAWTRKSDWMLAVSRYYNSDGEEEKRKARVHMVKEGSAGGRVPFRDFVYDITNHEENGKDVCMLRYYDYEDLLKGEEALQEPENTSGRKTYSAEFLTQFAIFSTILYRTTDDDKTGYYWDDEKQTCIAQDGKPVTTSMASGELRDRMGVGDKVNLKMFQRAVDTLKRAKFLYTTGKRGKDMLYHISRTGAMKNGIDVNDFDKAGIEAKDIL